MSGDMAHAPGGFRPAVWHAKAVGVLDGRTVVSFAGRLWFCVTVTPVGGYLG